MTTETSDAPSAPPRRTRYELDEVLTVDEVAAWLAINPKSVLRSSIKRLQIGRCTTRYFARDVYAWLESTAA